MVVIGASENRNWKKYRDNRYIVNTASKKLKRKSSIWKSIIARLGSGQQGWPYRFWHGGGTVPPIGDDLSQGGD